MKRRILFLFTSLLFLSAYAHAVSLHLADTTQRDTGKINKKIRNLQADLSGYQSDLTKTQSQIPIDSVALINATAKSNDALADSKKAASDALGGDLSDAKKAAKKAKQAANASSDADDAQRQLDKDRKKVKKLNAKIAKTEKKISDLQTGQ